MARSFRFHVSNYAWAEIAGTVAGLISFPILTRLLSVSDYGTMNLVASVLGVTIALGKLGIQHAVLRSWAEVQAGNSPHTPAAFEATVLWGMAGTGLLVTGLWAAAVWLLPSTAWGEPHIGAVMLLAAPLIAVRVLDSALTNQLRAQEASLAMALYGTAKRYASLLVVVLVLWFVSRDLDGFYVAALVIEAIALAALLVWMFRGRRWPSARQVSWPLYGSLAVFGLPMLGSELSTVVLTMSDRFIIQDQLSAEALGVYAASYNMCDYMRNALLGAMVGAAYPRCMRLWESEGAAGLQHFLGRFLHLYAFAAFYMVALMTVVGGEFMAVLASSRYEAGGEVTGWIMAGLSLQSVLTVAAVGLYLAKRTLLAMSLVLGAGILSIAANLVLVPALGIRGAGITVLLVFVVLGAAQVAVSRHIAPVVIPWRGIVTFGLAGALAWAAGRQVHLGGAWANLLAQGGVLTLVYVFLSLLLDRSLRTSLRGTLERWRSR